MLDSSDSIDYLNERAKTATTLSSLQFFEFRLEQIANHRNEQIFIPKDCPYSMTPDNFSDLVYKIVENCNAHEPRICGIG